MNLPTSIPAVVGKEINIYFKNILESDPSQFDIDISGGIGIQQNERWTATPDKEGTVPIVIRLYKNGQQINALAVNIITKQSNVGNGVNKKCIFIGDSTTDTGVYTNELLNIFSSDVMDITLLGTRGTAPNNHEGRSGWTAKLYTTVANSVNGSGVDVPNAFWDPSTSAFDFSYYMTQQSYESVDYVFINLGINDTFNYTDDDSLKTETTNILARYQTMIDSIHAYNTDIKIGIMVTIPPSANQDAFGDDYFNWQTQWRYKRNNWIWAEALLAYFKNKETSGIYIVPVNVNLDTEHNMQTETVAVNSRNSSTVVRQNNGLHPADSGYYQIADVVYYWLKGFEN